MTPAQIKRLFVLLWGNQYATAAAEEVGVSRQTIVQWVAGKWKPDDTRLGTMKKIAAKRIEDIGKAVKALGK